MFSSTQIAWSEPWFFVVRIRQWWGWRNRLLLAAGLSVLFILLVYFLTPGGRGLLESIGLGLAAGFALTALLDVANIQREVTVTSDSIIVDSAVNWGWTWSATFKLDSIDAIQLNRPQEWSKPYGGMIIVSKDEGFVVAIPRKVSLETVADVLNRLGLTVSLSGWEPRETDTRIAVRSAVPLDPTAAHGEVAISPIGEQEGPLLPPVHVAVQLVIALGPLLLAVLAAVAAGVFLYLNWGNVPLVSRIVYIAGAVIGLVVSFAYLLLVGQFVAAGYGVRIGRGRLPARPGTQFSGNQEGVVCVEIFDRDSWTASVAHSTDFGFLRIDRQERRLQFEGNKTRWTLPLSALTACRIEESIVGSEGDPNAEKRYYVVIEAPHDGASWEAGMIFTRTEVGNDTAEKRHQRAQLLFAQLADALAASPVRTEGRD